MDRLWDGVVGSALPGYVSIPRSLKPGANIARNRG